MYVKKEKDKAMDFSESDGESQPHKQQSKKARKKEKKKNLATAILKQSETLDDSFEAKKALTKEDKSAKKKTLKQQEQIVENFQELTKKYQELA